jgi:hypothetical protein
MTGHDTSLVARPCCYFNGATPINIVDDVARHFDTMSKIVDYASANGNCNQCLRRETSGFRTSIRQMSFEQIPADAGNHLTNLEIQIDNECNAACIMCSDTFSTQWATQNAKFDKIYTMVDYSQHATQGVDIIGQLDLSCLTFMKILGGEPFYTDTHKKVLLAIPNYQNLTIQYVTNGSVFPDSYTLDIWKQCKEIKIVFSIDDIGHRYEYIRWPLQWHQLEQNIQQFLLLTDIQFTFQINVTLNPLNVYYLDQIENKIKKIFDTYSYETFETFCKIDIADYTKVALANTPDTLRKLCYDKYGDNHRLTKMLKILPTLNHSAMITWLDTLDQQRKQTPWHRVFPEIANYF